MKYSAKVFTILLFSIVCYIFSISVVYGESQPKKEANPQVQPHAQPQVQPQVQRKTVLDFKEELKLTRDQEERIKKIIEGFQKREREISEKMRLLDGEIRKSLEENGEIKEIEKKVKELFQSRAEVVIEEIKAGREIDRVLNAEQREKLRKIRKGEKP
ncbi:LTXXQ motif family protein [Thermodesulfovibrio aggregans]|uniref:LTXXQ motif family protein n=1 Tax=Thermodesulfovibrio aggregans TaxID=86166 RepID=A0A0U9HN60_9BACT|nr:Spy/CpxP family protein refolding chaperone [Thermodesulfovibrio aggregans]GAQ94508.1 LTXXQ motif family protein [Thermodesulfovibrio aggregans]